MTSTASEQQPEWELRKENAAPLARGRNASTLSRALSSSAQVDNDSRRTNDKRMRQFERLVRPSERAAELVAERAEEGRPIEKTVDPMELLLIESGQDGNDDESIAALAAAAGTAEQDDPLVHWLSYIKFHQEACPSDTRAQFLLMERCTRTIVAFPRYRDDVRFVRVCVLYADKTSSPSDIFKFLHQKGVGSRTALFWIAWAWVAEKADDYRFAEKVYLKGLSKKAKPTKMLEQRHKQFQRRMSRHWLNNTSLDQANLDEAGNGAGSDGGSGVRGALSGLTEGGVRRNHRARGSNSDLSFSSGMQSGNNGHGWAHHQQVQQQQQHAAAAASANNGGTSNFGTRRSGSTGRPNSVMAKAGFSIFVDENEADNGAYNLNRSHEDGGAGAGHNRIATEADRIKENEGRTERWNERGGLGREDQDGSDENDDGGGLYVQQQRRPAAPTFEVFVDDECAAENKREEEERLKRQREKEGDGRSLRQRMDGGVVSTDIWLPLSTGGIKHIPLTRILSSYHIICTVFPSMQADRLQRDPLRYMRNPSKKSSDQAKYGDDVTASARKSTRREDALPPRSGSKKSSSSSGSSSSRHASQGTTKSNAKASSMTSKPSGKQLCGFDKTLCEKDKFGQECCFEEARMQARYYKLVSPDQDFNLLKVERPPAKPHHSQDDSAMDVDASSIDDFDMDADDDDENAHNVTMESAGAAGGAAKLDVSVHHKSAFNSSDVNGTGIESSRKAPMPMPKRVLFGGLDSSIASIGGNSQTNLSAVSAASSTVDERHATGVAIGKEEETINTKFAMKELSMMFASPAGGADDSDAPLGRSIIGGGGSGSGVGDIASASKPLFSLHTARKVKCNLTPPSEAKSSSVDDTADNGDTATFSVVADLVNGGNSGESSAPPLASSAGGFEIFCDENQPDGSAAGATSGATGAGGFEIFCDKNQDDGNAPSPPATSSSAAPFSIYQDPTSTIGHDGHQAAGGTLNDSSDDDDDSSCADDEGATATLGEIGEAFTDLMAASGEDKPSSMAKSVAGTGAGFSIFEDGAGESGGTDGKPAAGAAGASGFSIFVDGEDDTGTDNISPREHNLNDEDTTNGFGAVDISRIAPCDDMTGTISSSLDIAAAAPLQRHQESIIKFGPYWIRSVKSATRSIAASFNSRSRRTSHLIDCRDMEVPRCIRGKSPVKGAEIDLDDVTAVVQQKLGQGGFGVVMLCHSKNDGESFAGQETLALKVQTPTSCLAHEHNMLCILEERIPYNDGGSGNSGRRGSRKRRSSSGSASGNSSMTDSALHPFPRAFSYVQFDNGALLGMSSASSSGVNLIDVVNAYLQKKEPIPELIAIQYTSRMLLHLEKLHCVGKILHNDVKPDNWVVSGTNGIDVTLVDFGRSVDLVKAGKGDYLSVLFTGNEAAQDMACPPMRQEEPWLFETDAYGLAASSFLLLYSAHLDITQKADGKWAPVKSLRRYWASSLWNRIFSELLNAKSGDVSALMRDIRIEFEAYLDQGNRRSHVGHLLAHQSTLLPSSK